MPTDKILMTASALSGIYGLQLTAMPAKSGETFYNVSSPTRDAVGVAKWLGFAQCMNATNMAIIANCSDDEARKKGKMAGAAFSFLGAGMAVHQQSANGMDKTQVAVAAGSNIVLGALLLKDALGK